MASALENLLFLAAAGFVAFAVWYIFFSSPSSATETRESVDDGDDNGERYARAAIAALGPTGGEAPRFSQAQCKQPSSHGSRLWEDCLLSFGARSCVPENTAAKFTYDDAVDKCTGIYGFKPGRGPLDAGVSLVPRLHIG